MPGRPSAHFIYGSGKTLGAVRAALVLAGYVVPEQPAISACCAENGCAGCGRHWMLRAYDPPGKVARPGGCELARVARGAVYGGGRLLVVACQPGHVMPSVSPVSLAGEIRGYTFPVCPECGNWTVIYSKQESADYCTVCGWMSAQDD